MLTLSLVAAGLGNMQRFPYLMGEHGGGAFFVSYLIALCVLSVPVLIAEVAIGSLGRGSPGLALHWAASVGNLDSRWRHLGVAQALLGLVFAAVATLTTVWCLHCVMALYSGQLASASAIDVAADFLAFVDDRPAQFMQSLTLLAADRIEDPSLRGADLQCGLHVFTPARARSMAETVLPFYGGELHCFYESVSGGAALGFAPVEVAENPVSAYRFDEIARELLALPFLARLTRAERVEAFRRSQDLYADWPLRPDTFASDLRAVVTP